MAFFLRALLVVVALIVTDTTAFAQATATPTPTRAAAATPIPCSTTPAGVVVIMLENPAPGDTLLTGTQVVMNGIAFDTRSTSGPGIALVTIYLGPRDAGGVSLGTATLGQPNPSVPAGTPLANAGFTLRSSALPGGSGARSLFVYARALQDNTEGVLEVPIFLNSAPTPVRGQVPTAVLPTPVPCTPTPVATSTPAPATNTPVVPATSTPVVAATPTPINVVAPLPPAPVAPAAPVATPAPVVAVAPTTAQTAPRGGGIPSEVGLIVVVIGAAIAGGALTLRRRR